MNNPVPEEQLDSPADDMLDAAMGGLTPHQLLVRASLAEAADSAEREAARIRNHERARQLLEAIEKSLDRSGH